MLQETNRACVRAPRLLMAAPWFYGWNIVVAGVIFQGVTFGIGLSSFAYLVSDWREAFAADRADVMWASTVSVLAMGVISPFSGPVLDRLPIRILTTIGSLAFSAGMFLISIATALWQIVVVYAVLLALGMTLAGALATSTLTAKWFRARRGLALGIVSMGTSIGGMVFPPIVTSLLMLEGGWREAHVVLGILSAVVLIPISWFVVRSSPEEAGVVPEPESEHSLATASVFGRQDWTTAKIIRSPALWITVVAFLPPNIILLGVQQNMALFADDLGLERDRASHLVPMIAAAMLVGKLVFGVLSDRVDSRHLFWVAVALFATSLLMMSAMPGYWLLLLACGVMGLGVGANMPLLGAIVASRFGPLAFGRATGIVYMFTTLSAFGSVFGGYIRDVSGSYSLMLWVFLGSLAPAALVMTFMPRAAKTTGLTAPVPNGAV